MSREYVNNGVGHDLNATADVLSALIVERLMKVVEDKVDSMIFGIKRDIKELQDDVDAIADQQKGDFEYANGLGIRLGELEEDAESVDELMGLVLQSLGFTVCEDEEETTGCDGDCEDCLVNFEVCNSSAPNDDRVLQAQPVPTFDAVLSIGVKRAEGGQLFLSINKLGEISNVEMLRINASLGGAINSSIMEAMYGTSDPVILQDIARAGLIE